MKKETIVYTDGACSGNPGPGACVSIIVNSNVKLIKAYVHTTNNRMELRAVIQALEYLDTVYQENTDFPNIKIVSDSLYIVDAINKGWLNKWSNEHFYKRPNSDLWITLKILLTGKDCSFSWCRAHELSYYNNEADKLAKTALKNNQKEIDIGYVQDKTFSKTS